MNNDRDDDDQHLIQRRGPVSFNETLIAMLWLERLRAEDVCRYKDLPPTYLFDGNSEINANVGVLFDNDKWALIVNSDERYRWLYECDWVAMYIVGGDIMVVSRDAPVPLGVINSSDPHSMTPRFAIMIRGNPQLVTALSNQDHIEIKMYSVSSKMKYIIDNLQFKRIRIVVREALFDKDFYSGEHNRIGR